MKAFIIIFVFAVSTALSFLAGAFTHGSIMHSAYEAGSVHVRNNVLTIETSARDPFDFQGREFPPISMKNLEKRGVAHVVQVPAPRMVINSQVPPNQSVYGPTYGPAQQDPTPGMPRPGRPNSTQTNIQSLGLVNVSVVSLTNPGKDNRIPQELLANRNLLWQTLNQRLGWEAITLADASLLPAHLQHHSGARADMTYFFVREGNYPSAQVSIGKFVAGRPEVCDPMAFNQTEFLQAIELGTWIRVTRAQ